MLITQGADMEQLVLAYARQIEKMGPVRFWAQVAVDSMKPGKKGRSFINSEAGKELSKAIKAFVMADGLNRMAEESMTDPDSKVISVTN
jgi:hypothetical protein